VHDYFEILGLAGDAPADEIRRASARRADRPHPDFAPGARSSWSDSSDPRSAALSDDVAIDYVDMSAIVGRMRAAFFASTE